MPVYLGANSITKAYLGSNEVPALYLGANEVFAGGSPPAYTGDTYQGWDDKYLDETVPTPPATTAPDLEVTDEATLASQLAAAGSEAAADLGSVTRVVLTDHIDTINGFNITTKIYPGATVIFDSGVFQIDGKSAQTTLQFHGVGDADEEGFGPKVKILSVAYTGTGLGINGEDTIVTFDTVLPKNEAGGTDLAVDDVLSIFNICTTNANTFKDPADGAYIWCREPWNQRFGAKRRVKAINGLVVTLEGHLYDSEHNHYDIIAGNATYPLWGAMMLAKAGSLYILNYDVLDTDNEMALLIKSLRDVHIIDATIDQINTVDASKGKIEAKGCYEVTIWDSVIHNDDDVHCVGTYAVISFFSTARLMWKYTGAIGSPAQVKGYGIRNMRHGVDTASGSWNLHLAETDGYYACHAGPSMETGELNTVYGDMNSTYTGSHSASVGARRSGVTYPAVQSNEGVSEKWLNGERGSQGLIHDTTFTASEKNTTQGVNVISFSNGAGRASPGSGESDHNSNWHNKILRCTFNMDAAGRTIKGVRTNACWGPMAFEDNNFNMTFASGDGFIYQMDMSKGVKGDTEAFIDEVLPGYVWNYISGDVVTPLVAMNHTLVNVLQQGKVAIADLHLDLASQDSLTWIGVVSDVTTLAVGHIYVTDKGSAVVTETSDGDITGLKYTYGAPPTTKPNAAATFTATKDATNPDTEIDLAFTAGTGGAVAYYILEHSLDDASWRFVDNIGPDVVAYAHTGLAPSTTHYYRLRAVNGKGVSGASAANATTDAGGSSAEVTAVRAIMTNLTAAEDTAMETFVDGCVTDGNWSEIDVFVYYGLDYEGAGGDQTDWLGSAPDSAKGGTITKDAYDGWAKTAASANYIDTGIDLTADLTNADADSDIVLAVFMASTNDITTNNVSPFGVEASGGNPDRLQVIMRGSAEDKARVFPRDSGTDSGTGTYVSPFSGEWMGIILNATADYIGGAPSSVVEAGIDVAIGTGTVPSNNLYLGSNNKGNSGDDGVWACTMTALVIAKASGTFDLDAFSTRMATFKAAVDAQNTTSAEVTAVRAILENLTAAEDTAMEIFLDGCVADNSDNWAPVDFFYYYGLDSTADDKLDWKANAGGNMSVVGTVTKTTHDGYAKSGGNSHYIKSGINLSTDVVSASASDIICAIFVTTTNDFTTNSPTPFGAEDADANDRFWLQMRGGANDMARLYALTTIAAIGSVGDHIAPFTNEWLGMVLNGTSDFIGGTSGSIAEDGIDGTIGAGNLPNIELWIGAENNEGVATQGSWQPTVTAIVVAKASTFSLSDFAGRFNTFKAAVDAQ